MPVKTPARPIVFADSKAALDIARARGLIGVGAEIRSFSPALANRDGIVRADIDMTPARILALEQATLACSLALYDSFREDQAEALVIARAAGSELPGLAFHALALDDGDLDRPLSVLGVDFGDPEATMFLGAPFSGLDGGGLEVEALRVEEADMPPVDSFFPSVASLPTRLRHASLPSLGYRMAANFWMRVGRRGPRGSIMIIRENELLKETAFALATMGFAIHRLEYPRVDDASAAEVAPKLGAAAGSIVRARLDGLLPDRLAMIVGRAFGRRAELAVGRYRILEQRLVNQLDAKHALRPLAVLSNVKFEPEAVAIRSAASARGLASFCFAHGFAAECSARERPYLARHENVLGDTAIVFTELAKSILDANQLRVGNTIAVGLPMEHLKRPSRGAEPSAPPIWYVSTALYNGSYPVLCIGVSDCTIAERESVLIEDVLSRLPHRVLYKPYPARRYLDADPVIELARGKANIDVRSDGVDLRYIAGQARVLVTSRATSTVCWCLTSGRPVVFIDHVDELPLTDDARAAFRDGLFLFETSDPGWRDALRQLLSRPIHMIEAEWVAKAAARGELMRRYFSCEIDGRAGRRAAHAIVARLGNRAHNVENMLP